MAGMRIRYEERAHVVRMAIRATSWFLLKPPLVAVMRMERDATRQRLIAPGSTIHVVRRRTERAGSL